jgi:hypothetical protein
MKKPIVTSEQADRSIAFFIISDFLFGAFNYVVGNYRASAILFGIIAGLAFVSNAIKEIARYLTNKKNA